MRSRSRLRTRGSLLALALLLLTSCTGVGAERQPESGAPSGEATEAEAVGDGESRAGGTLRVGLSVAPATIDPRFIADAQGELIVNAVFEPLVRLDAQQRVVPAAARDWSREDGGRVWTFELREAEFHDGTPVAAEDFARTFRRIADGTAERPSFLAYLLEPVEGFTAAQERGEPLAGVEVVDDRTLRLHLSRPEPGFVRTLAHPSLVPVPEAAEETPEAYARQPVGNGPFAVAEPVESGGFVRLSGREDHPAQPRLDAVVFQVYADESAQQLDDLLDGQLHVADVVAGRLEEAIERVGRSADGYRGPGLLSGLTSTVYLYGFDTTTAPYDDPRVRRAVSLSIDRERLSEEVFGGAREPADAIVPPPIPGSQPGICGHCRHAPEEARALLAESGAALEEITLTYNRGPTHAAIAEEMAADIEAALDVAVDLQGADLGPFLRTVRSSEAPVFRLGLDADTPDAGAYLHPLLHSSMIGLENLTRFADDDVDALLERARRTTDDEEAVELWREAERRALAQAAVVPLLNYRINRVVADGVRDLYWSPFGRVDLARVWLADEA